VEHSHITRVSQISLLTLTGEKLLFLSRVYWFSKLFDYLKLLNINGLVSYPYVITTTVIVVQFALILYREIPIK